MIKIPFYHCLLRHRFHAVEHHRLPMAASIHTTSTFIDLKLTTINKKKKFAIIASSWASWQLLMIVMQTEALYETYMISNPTDVNPLKLIVQNSRYN